MSLQEPDLEADAPAVCPVCGLLFVSPTALALAATSVEVDAATRPSKLLSSPVTLPDVPGYVVTALLGRGGMGSVYCARHLRLGRMVALKMISGDHASPERLARFQAETLALARLQHPHIVQIYEVSESRGLPYFAMEFLEGGGLDRKLAGRPQPPKDAAGTVELLARAIDAAHQQGIVHRDLKPANILLTRDGQPKISDFGLVKRLEGDLSQTRTGDILGTPIYMAPEQVAGSHKAIGAGTDIYALGAILYEMLTGRPPFRGTTAVETFELIRSAEPVPVRRLQPGVPRDLETICLKCLEKAPDKRYASARALADDLGRFQANQPIAARRAGLAYRLGKWARRRPALAALVAVVLVATLGTAALGIWYNARLRSAAQRADQRSRLARGVVDDMYTKVAEEWLIDEPFKDPLRQEFLEKAMRLYEEFVREEGSDPELVRESALAHFRLGQIHRILNQHATAQEAYGQAIRLQRSLYERFPGQAQYRQDLANSHNWLGELLRESGQGTLAQAEEHYNAARELQEGLMAEFPGEPAYCQEAARSHYNLGIVHIDLAQKKLAGEHLEQALDLLTTLQQKFPEVSSYRHELARCLINRGVLLKNSDPEQAQEDYERAIGHLTKLQATARFRAVYRIDLASVRQNLGNLLGEQDETATALDELTQAQDLLAELAHDFPTRPGYKEKLANCCNSLASVRAGVKDFAKAQEDWGRARAVFEQLVGDYPTVPDYHYRLGITLGNLGWLRSRQEDLPAARRFLQKAIEPLQAALTSNPNNPEYLRALRNQYQNLAEISVQLGDHAAAAQAAAALAKVVKDRQDLYFAACFLARCAPLAAQDQQLPDAQARDQCAKKYLDQSLVMLRNAARAHAGGVQRLTNEREVFQPLLHDPETVKLLAQLSSNP
jgi:serine/threonine-protein kinase